ncbi:MAG: hypothetical protein HY555_03550 [Euryarchaeota archaeon]|nr:hypothetical protein [Euryarchaeota archaeon]
MFESVRELDEEELDAQEFLGLVAGLVRVSKGMDAELREADLQANRQEFSRMWQERMLIYRERMRR